MAPVDVHFATSFRAQQWRVVRLVAVSQGMPLECSSGPPAETPWAWRRWLHGSGRRAPRYRAYRVSIDGSSACFASGPWQASQFTFACLPPLLVSATSAWQVSQVSCPAKWTGWAAISPMAAPR